ncbi:MAG: hypothetical protein EB166_00710 [Thaumarchaeota archaeon]|nr:hypothetical protein [Nitrososphaerota archaeon]
MVLDSSGNIYVAGETTSSNFPGINGTSADSSLSGTDMIVSKISGTLRTMMQSTYVGGTLIDRASAIALDSSGNVYVAGETTSSSFPGATGGSQASIGSAGTNDMIVVKLASNLRSLTQSTYLGGTSADRAFAIAIDSTDHIYIAGDTSSSTFGNAATRGYQTSKSTGSDYGIAKFNSTLTGTIRATYLGGDNTDRALTMFLDSSGNVYVAGDTQSSNFPGVSGGYNSTKGTGRDYGIAKLNSTLNGLIQSTYLGGNADDGATAVQMVMDSSDNIYITGDTASSNFPGTSNSNIQSSRSTTTDFSISKLSSDLRSLVRSTYLGGNGIDIPYAIAVDSNGVYVAGETQSSNFPGTSNAYQTSNGGGRDFVISRLNTSLSILYQSTYLGGAQDDIPRTMKIDSSSNLYVAGQTSSTGSTFPGVNASSIQSSLSTATDGAVSKITFDLTLSTTRTPDDTLAMSDSVSASSTKLVTLSDTLNINDTMSALRSTSASFTDALAITDSVTASKSKSTSASDTLALTDAISASHSATKSASDSLSISDTITTAHSATKSVSDTMSLIDTITTSHSVVRSVSDTLAINDTISVTKSKLVSLSDTLSITDTIRAARAAVKSVSDTLSITDTISIIQAKLVSLSDSLSITHSTSTTKEEGATLGPTVVVARIIAPNKIVVEFNKNITSTLHSVIGKYVTLTISPNVTAGQTGQMTLASTIKSLFNISYDTTNNPVPIVNNLGSDPVVLNSTQKTLAFTVNNSPVTKVFIKDGTDSKFDLSVVPNKVTANSRTNVTTNNQLDITFGSGTSNQIDFRLPANLTISGPSANFTGLIDFPERQSTGSCPPKFEGTDSVVSCVDVGKYGVELTLNKPARLVLKGEGAHSPYYGVTPSVLRTKITTQCNADDFNTVSSQISSSGTVRECYIVSGDDMVIWTTHFTSYGTIRAGSSSSSTSNGTSGSSPGSGPINVDVTDLIRSDNYDPDGFGSGISLIVHSIEYDKKTNHVTVILSTSAPPANVMIQGGTQRYSAGLESIQPYLEQRKLVYSANLPDSTSMTILVMDKRDHLSYKVLINQDHYFVSYYNPGYEKYLKKFQTVPDEPEKEIITDAKEQYFKQTEIRLKQLTNTYNEQQMHIFLKTLSKQFTEEQMKVLEQVLDKYN